MERAGAAVARACQGDRRRPARVSDDADVLPQPPADPSALITASRAAEREALGRTSLRGAVHDLWGEDALACVGWRASARPSAQSRRYRRRGRSDLSSAGVAIRGVTGFDPIVGLGPTARPVGQIVERRRRLRRARPDHRTAGPRQARDPQGQLIPGTGSGANRRPRSGPGSRSATATSAGADARCRAAPARAAPSRAGTGRPCSSLRAHARGATDRPRSPPGTGPRTTSRRPGPRSVSTFTVAGTRPR